MLEDRLLIWKFKQGSTAALSRIYEKYGSELLTVAVNLSGDRAAAEDVVQDVFISFVQTVHKFQLRGSLKGYLAACVANRARDRLRKNKRSQTVAISRAEQLTANTAGPVQLAIESEELKKAELAMANLPYEQRETIVMRLHGGLKFRTIAKLQNVSIKTVQGRYRYGLNKLRTILNTEVTK